MPPFFHPEPEQIAALSRWLASSAIADKLALFMPLCGGPRSACKCRVLDVAAALQVVSVAGGFESEWSVEHDLYRALKRLLIECGEGSRKGRAIDLLSRETIDMAQRALDKADGK